MKAFLIITIFVLSSCSRNNNSNETYEKTRDELYPIVKDNTLSFQEREEGWILLWDGLSTAGWKSLNNTEFPEKGWYIRDGMLIAENAAKSEFYDNPDIISTLIYDNFELVVDFKLLPGSKSGIIYLFDTESNSNHGLEYQLSRDSLGSLYELICSPKDIPFFDDEFNTARIVVKNQQVEHWLNGVKILDFNRGGKEWKELVKYSSFNVISHFGEQKRGHILLQNKGQEVHFKNLKIKEIRE